MSFQLREFSLCSLQIIALFSTEISVSILLLLQNLPLFLSIILCCDIDSEFYQHIKIFLLISFISLMMSIVLKFL